MRRTRVLKLRRRHQDDEGPDEWRSDDRASGSIRCCGRSIGVLIRFESAMRKGRCLYRQFAASGNHCSANGNLAGADPTHWLSHQPQYVRRAHLLASGHALAGFLPLFKTQPLYGAQERTARNLRENRGISDCLLRHGSIHLEALDGLGEIDLRPDFGPDGRYVGGDWVAVPRPPLKFTKAICVS